MNDRLIPPGDAARILGVTPRTLRRWAEEGRIRVVRTLGGHARYHEQELRDLAERGDGDRT